MGRYHLGDFVNRMQPGSLVMKMPDSEQAEVPTQLFATISGVIGVIAQLPKDKFDKLSKLQVNCTVCGAFPHRTRLVILPRG